MEFCKAFNASTQDMEKGLPIPVVITVYSDRSFTIITKTPPASVLLKKSVGLAKWSSTPNTNKVGTVTREQMEVIADLAEDYSADEIRITHKQNVVLAHVRQSDLHALWQRLDAAGLATANIGLTTDIIACPGLDYCNLANARSIPVAQRLSLHFNDPLNW